MTKSENCPKCGAAAHLIDKDTIYYDCGSYYELPPEDKLVEDHGCLRRQLSAAQSQVEQAREACRTWCLICDLGPYPSPSCEICLAAVVRAALSAPAAASSESEILREALRDAIARGMLSRSPGQSIADQEKRFIDRATRKLQRQAAKPPDPQHWFRSAPNGKEANHGTR